MENEKESTFEWAIRQISLRLNEYTALQRIPYTEATASRLWELEERVEVMMQEIMKIAFVAQLELETEAGDDLHSTVSTVLGLISYLTGDPNDIEVVVREESESDQGGQTK